MSNEYIRDDDLSLDMFGRLKYVIRIEVLQEASDDYRRKILRLEDRLYDLEKTRAWDTLEIEAVENMITTIYAMLPDIDDKLRALREYYDYWY